MKKIILIIVAVVMTSATIYAQDKKSPPKTPEERAEKITKKMTEELILTKDQQVKIKALMLKKEEENAELRKAKKIRHEKLQADMKAILTAEQYKRMQEKHDKKKQHDGKK